MTQKARDWDELERLANIRRSVRPAPTQRDAAELTLRRLRKSPFWRKRK